MVPSITPHFEIVVPARGTRLVPFTGGSVGFAFTGNIVSGAQGPLYVSVGTTGAGSSNILNNRPVQYTATGSLSTFAVYGIPTTLSASTIYVRLMCNGWRRDFTYLSPEVIAQTTSFAVAMTADGGTDYQTAPVPMYPGQTTPLPRRVGPLETEFELKLPGKRGPDGRRVERRVVKIHINQEFCAAA